jgi:hypothetical protein
MNKNNIYTRIQSAIQAELDKIPALDAEYDRLFSIYSQRRLEIMNVPGYHARNDDGTRTPQAEEIMTLHNAYGVPAQEARECKERAKLWQELLDQLQQDK